jgi:two-component system chemotaxis response regulator CheY
MAQTVLIVDDSKTMRDMVAFTLTGAGFEVVQASDGKEAVGKLSNGSRPVLLVTDLNVPEMDGLTLIKEVRKMPTLKFTPIFVLTTESSDEMKAAGKAACATGWIVKPFRPDQFFELGRVNTNGHFHEILRTWKSPTHSIATSSRVCRRNAATSLSTICTCSTPSCTSPSRGANGVGCPRGSATGTPSILA